MRLLVRLLMLISITSIATATPMVVVKTRDGYILGTDGSLVWDNKVVEQVCKFTTAPGFALMWAGSDTLGHKDKAGKYVIDISLSDHFKKILMKGGSFAAVKAAIIESSKADTRLHLKQHPELYVPGIYSEIFVLASALPIGPAGMQVGVFSSDEKEPYAKKPTAVAFKTQTVSLDGVSVLWLYGHQHIPRPWNLSLTARSQEAGQARAKQALEDIWREAKKEGKPGFDPPYVYLSVTPQGLSIIDPAGLCPK